MSYHYDPNAYAREKAQRAERSAPFELFLLDPSCAEVLRAYVVVCQHRPRAMWADAVKGGVLIRWTFNKPCKNPECMNSVNSGRSDRAYCSVECKNRVINGRRVEYQRQRHEGRKAMCRRAAA